MSDNKKIEIDTENGVTIKLTLKISTDEDPDIDDMTVEQLEAYLTELEDGVQADRCW